ncbi:MAG TPA: MFS transporter [Patescibacteria group bacterium]|nr:MFS transporter [Patescibacteria group bacterium]
MSAAKSNRIKTSLRFSLLDGIFAASMTGLTADYITPYALVLKASPEQVGLLSATPNLASSLIQLKSADLTERLQSRKKVINISVLLHTLVLVPIILIPYVFKAQAVWVLIACMTLFTSLNAFAVPAWSSLMSNHIPYRMRGKFFGWRNRVLGTITIVSGFIAGLILHAFHQNVLRGFLIVLTSAFVCRMVSWYFLTRMYEPPLRIRSDTYFSFFDFIGRVKESNFARFVVFVAGLNFCVNLAAPFFSVFMLRDLKFSYLTYTAVVATVSITTICTIDRWGRLADRIGNIRVIKMTSLIIASLPVWWVINRHPAYLVFFQVLSGFAWAGFNLCATNFIYDAVTAGKRLRCIAYFNVLTGLALCLGALAGGYLVSRLPPLFGYKILCLFLVSSTLRFIVVCFLSGKIKEVRSTDHISSKDLFYSVIGMRPILGITQDSRQGIREED